MKSKKALLATFTALLVFLCCFTLFFNYGYIKGLNPIFDEKKKDFEIFAHIEGDITDSKGNIICSAEEPGIKGSVEYESFYDLLGYYDPYKRMSEGLRKDYKPILWDTAKDNKKGNTIQLTIDKDIQEFAYKQFDLFIDNSGKGSTENGEESAIHKNSCDGSIIVLENKTGNILALATANKQYVFDVNANLPSEDLKRREAARIIIPKEPVTQETTEMTSEVDSTTEAASEVESTTEKPREDLMSSNLMMDYLIPKWWLNRAPGSSIKPLVAIPIIEKKLQNERIEDEEPYLDISNAASIKKRDDGRRNLQEALTDSSNVYFAKMGVEKLGINPVRNIYDKFLIGQTLKLDFTTLSNSGHGLNENFSDFNLAQCSFGQGTLSLTPINLAIIGSTLGNSGKITLPHLIKSIDGTSFTKFSKNYKLSKLDRKRLNTEDDKSISTLYDLLSYSNENSFKPVADKTVIQTLTDMLRNVAKDGDNYKALDPKYNIAAKTGTAQTPNPSYKKEALKIDSSIQPLLYRCDLLTYTDDYTVVIVIENCDEDEMRYNHRNIAGVANNIYAKLESCGYIKFE